MYTSQAEENFDYDLKTASAVITLLIFCFGIIGNFLVILIIAILKDFKKSVTNWYILQLAIADTIYLLTLPFNVSETIHERWIYSEGLCKVKEAVFFINYYASIMFLMIMSIDRYIAVCQSFSDFFHNLRKHAAAYVITGVTWAAAILLGIPILMYTKKDGAYPFCKCRSWLSGINFPDALSLKRHLEDCLKHAGSHQFLIDVCYENFEGCVPFEFSGYEYSGASEDFNSSRYYMYYPDSYVDDNSSFGLHSGEDELASNNSIRNEIDDGFILEDDCTPGAFTLGWKIFVWLNFSVMFLFPFLVISICYGLIIHHLIASPTSIRSSRADQDRRRVIVLCIVLVGAFAGCWVMFHAVHIAKMYNIYQSREFCGVLTAFSVWLTFINSALNPYLYTFMGTGFSRKWQSIKKVPIVQSMINFKLRTTTTTSDGRSRWKTGNQSREHCKIKPQKFLQSNARSSASENTKQVVENKVPVAYASVNE